MSTTSISKSYQAIVTMSDDTDIAFDVEVSYYDDDSMCIPDIEVSIVEQPEDRQGMVEEFEDEITDALDRWFTNDACNTNDGEHLCFTFDTTTEEVELCEDEKTDDSCASFEDVLEVVRQELSALSNNDLAKVAQEIGLQIDYSGDETFTINRG